MARVDDYIGAKKLAVEFLAKEPLDKILNRSGAILSDNRIALSFLNRMYHISYPDFEFTDADNCENQVPLQEQVLLLHYLKGDGKTYQTGKWIAYREIAGASFYFGAFVNRAIDPLKKIFGDNIEALEGAARKLNGKTIEFGDASFEFAVLPYVSLQVVVWEGDEEFPTEVNILFDESIGDVFSPEDAAWLASLLVYRLIALSK